jgi:hypothetical protein
MFGCFMGLCLIALNYGSPYYCLHRFRSTHIECKKLKVMRQKIDFEHTIQLGSSQSAPKELM